MLDLKMGELTSRPDLDHTRPIVRLGLLRSDEASGFEVRPAKLTEIGMYKMNMCDNKGNIIISIENYEIC